MRKKVIEFVLLFFTFGLLVFISKERVDASVGELIKLEASATTVKFNDPLTLSWTIDPSLLSGDMKCYDWDGDLLTKTTGTKTILHIRHQKAFQIGCSMVQEMADGTPVATAHASNMIYINIDTSEPVSLSETSSFDDSNSDNDLILQIEMNDKTYKIGRDGSIGNRNYKYVYIDTPSTTGTVSWKYDTTDFENCWFGSTDLGNYVRENVYEEVTMPGVIPGVTPSYTLKRIKSEGKANFDLSNDKNIILSCWSSSNVATYKQKTADMQILFYNIDGGSDAPAETSSTDISNSADPLKLTMTAGDKTYKVSGKAFDFTYDTSNEVLTKDNIGMLEVFTKSKDATLKWQADSSIFKYCQSDGQEMNNWPLGDVSLSGTKDIKIGAGTNLYQITCTSGDKASLYDGDSKMARVYILTKETSGLVIINDESGKQIIDDDDNESAGADNNKTTSDTDDEDTTKVKLKLIGNVQDSDSKEKIAGVGSNVKMTIECSDGKVRNLNTKDGYFIYNINNLPNSGCKLINNTDTLTRDNWNVADYQYKGYAICKDGDIGDDEAECIDNVLEKNTWNMSSIDSGSKYQIVYYYDKLDVENKVVDSNLEDKIDQLILMIKKILEKLGIEL